MWVWPDQSWSIVTAQKDITLQRIGALRLVAGHTEGIGKPLLVTMAGQLQETNLLEGM